jgi:Short C-terminal domain/Phospholipase_D-nuclease N-terminal
MLASSYPLLDLFWTMLWFFCFIIWIWLLITIFSDIFRSPDLGGWGKAGWTIFVLVIPLLGVLVYLIARGRTMQERRMKEAVDAQQQMDEYIRQTAGSSSSPATELSKLAELHSAGTISDAEFESAKAKILTS